MHESCLTLRALLMEYEDHARNTRKIWQPADSGDGKSNAGARIECTFEKLLDKPVSDITPEDLAATMQRYKPKRPQNGKRTADGGIARSRSYLKPVLDWAAGRGRFTKIGAGQIPYRSPGYRVDLRSEPARSDGWQRAPPRVVLGRVDPAFTASDVPGTIAARSHHVDRAGRSPRCIPLHLVDPCSGGRGRLHEVA